MRRGLRSVTGAEQVGPYALLRVDARRASSRSFRPVLHARGARAACCRGR